VTLAVAALLLIPSIPAPAGGTTVTLTTFSDGKYSAAVSFPDGGGWNNSTSIVLPRGASVSSARFDISPVRSEVRSAFSTEAPSLFGAGPASGIQLKGGDIELSEEGWWWESQPGMADHRLNGTAWLDGGLGLGATAYGMWAPLGFAPAARFDHTAVWDTTAGQMMVFGGWNDAEGLVPDMDIYSLQNDSWTTKAADIPSRSDHTAVWDERDSLMLVYGGTAGGPLNDLWAYCPSNNTWSRRADGPSPRAGHSAVWDASRGRMLVYGGQCGSSVCNDLWAYYAATDTWNSLGNYTAPPLAQHAAVYDAADDRMLLFGGVNDTGAVRNGTWVYYASTDSWTLNYAGPAPRQMPSAVFDAGNGRMLLFGGSNATGSLDDLWSYDVRNDTWYRLMAGASARGRQSAAWVPGDDRLLVLGGESQFYGGNDLWSYRLLRLPDGTAESPPISPGTGRNGTLWVNITLPPGTGYSVDILSGDEPGATLFQGLASGDRFSVPPGASSVRLRVHLHTGDANVTPVLHGWGVGTRISESFLSAAEGSASAVTADGGLRLLPRSFPAWEKMAAGPSPRSGQSAVWDPDNGQLLVFGGVDGSTYYNELWAFLPQQNVWLRKAPGPSGRAFHSAVWDPEDSTMVIYGGSNPAYLSDIWVYSPMKDSWTQKQPASVGARARHCAVWDPDDNLMLVFGGSVTPIGTGVYSKDMLAYSPSADRWSYRTSVNNGRHSASAVYDPQDHRMIIFGGVALGGLRMNDLWCYAPANDSWSLRDTPLAPRFGQSARWNPFEGEMLVAGGNTSKPVGEVWSYSYSTDRWTQRESVPAARFYSGMGIDARTGATVLFGGQGAAALDDCWMLSVSDRDWTQKPSSPSPRFGHSAVWDPEDSQMLVFGGTFQSGSGFAYFNELWAYCPSNDTWVAKAPGATPRCNHTAVWDSSDSLMLVFGGSDWTGCLSDLWAYSPATDGWTRLSDRPPARAGASAVWNAGRGQMLLYGGCDWTTNTTLNDLWAYLPSNDQWVQRVSGPLARSSQSAVWDEDLDRMLVFGGSCYSGAGEDFQNDLWAYYAGDGRWAQLGAGATPRRAASAVWEPGPSRLLLFGGETNDSVFDGLWECNFPDRTWRMRYGGPSPRSGCSAVLDPGTGQILLFGGRSGSSVLDELWSFGRVHDTAGSYLSPVLDIGRPASLGRLQVSASVPPGTELNLFFRSSENNRTWSGWELAGPEGGPLATAAQRYVQWRASLSTAENSSTPVLRSLEFNYTLFGQSGLLGPLTVASSGLIMRATPRPGAVLNNGSISISLSSDGGASWLEAPAGAEAVFPAPGRELAVRVRFGVSPDGASPVLRNLSIEYVFEELLTEAVLCIGNNSIQLRDIDAPRELDVTSLLNLLLAGSAQGEGPVEIPLAFFSASRGEMNLAGLNIVFGYNRPPAVTLDGPPGNSTFHSSSVRLYWSGADPDGDSLEYRLSWSDRPFSGNASGGLAVNATSYELAGLAMNTTYYWSVAVSDGRSGQSSPVRQFSTLNRPPIITSVPPTSARVGLELLYCVTATDEDGDQLSYDLVTPVAGMSVDSSTGMLRWTPSASQAGNQTVVVSVADIWGGEGLQSFRVDVTASYFPPVCRITRPIEGTRASGRLTVSGMVSAGALAVSRVEVRVDGGRWANATGTGTWNFTLDTGRLRNGNHIIEARAFDGTAFSEMATVTIRVANPAPAPGLQLPYWALAAALPAVAAAAALLVLARRRRRSRSHAPPSAPEPAGTVGGAGTAAGPAPPPAPAVAAAPPPSFRAYDALPVVLPVRSAAIPRSAAFVGTPDAAVPAVAASAGAMSVRSLPDAGPIVPGPERRPEFYVDDIFLMYKDGRLIQHNTRRIKADMDLDVMTSMLRAVQIFVRESLGLAEGADLGSMEYGENKVLILRGKYVILAVVITGEEPRDLRNEMRGVINDIEGEFQPVLEQWSGITGPLSQAKKFLSRLGAFQAPAAQVERVHNEVSLQSELEFFQGFVRVKIAVKNNMSTVIRRTALKVIFNEAVMRLDRIEPEYAFEGREILFGDIEPHEKRAVSIYLDPQICTESYLEGLFVFRDAQGHIDAVKLPRKLVSVVCPIMFTEHNINIAMLKRMVVEELDKKDAKVFSLPSHISAVDAFFIGKAAIEHHDMRMVRELVEPEPYVAEAWYFGKVKGREDRLVARIRSLGQRRVLEFYVATTSTLLLTGMLAELKTDLNKELESRKLRDNLKQVTAPDQINAVKQMRALLDKAEEADGRGQGPGAGGQEEARMQAPHEYLKP
jgi:N-acetylneuraminic acid mutarotase